MGRVTMVSDSRGLSLKMERLVPWSQDILRETDALLQELSRGDDCRLFRWVGDALVRALELDK